MNHFNESDKFLSLGSIRLYHYRERPKHRVWKGVPKSWFSKNDKGLFILRFVSERIIHVAGTQIPSVALESTGLIVLTLCSYLMAINSHPSETPA